ncbi:MAG: chorismate synthase [Gemmatimonadales bacterium]|nr:chorismate synthase [Gemmatimonadales bacterium]
MSRLRFLTAGESHGKGLVAIIEGVPAGLPITAEDVDRDLGRRMQGYGRGARMKIEQDRIEWLSGVRSGETLGSPVAMLIHNRDWANWQEIMAAEGTPGEERRRRVARPRPGHADLVGVLKYDRHDARDILERASARETAARVACGAVARRLLDEFGIDVGSHLVSLGGIRAQTPALPQSGAGGGAVDPLAGEEIPPPLRGAGGGAVDPLAGEEIPPPLRGAGFNSRSDASPVRTLDPAAEVAMIARIDQAKRDGDTLGGEIEVVVTGLPIGLGSHVHWDRKLDARLAGMLMSIPAVKGVEIGMGFEAARLPGSAVHDPIVAAPDNAPPNDPRGGFRRVGNNAGGLEGGMTTGEPLVVRVAMKPISTLMSPLKTVNLDTGAEAQAQSERSDVTAVPAMGVIAEALVALVLADALLEKTGGDSLTEMRRNLDAFLAAAGGRWQTIAAREVAP